MFELQQASLAVQELVDQVCDRFEAAWQQGTRPTIETYLADVDEAARAILLGELLRVEVACRRRAGELPQASDYQDQFPNFMNIVGQAIRGSSDESAASVTLVVVRGLRQGEKFTAVSHQTVVVGRAEDATWQFAGDPFFSRYHFRVEAQPPQCQLIDLESRNGTLVNGVRAAEVELKDGDRIECGETVFEVSIISTPRAGDTSTLDLSPAIPAPPQRLAEFQILGEIGRGAMGVVYRAVHRTTQREAAVKLIEPETAAREEAVQLFLREAHILSQLHHPRIVEYLSLGLHEGQMYLAMEYLPALNVRELLASQSRPRQMRLACGLACYMLEALEYAHSRDVVHRDVKPSNVLVYKAGKKVSLKLADFGLAKNFMHAGFSSITHENEVRGTLAYMAPEQLINCRYAKPACDIYSAGACLYFFLCGHAPYEAAGLTHSLARLLNSSPIPLAQRTPDVPLELAAVVDRALAREPGSRFASAQEMRERLQEVMSRL